MTMKHTRTAKIKIPELLLYTKHWGKNKLIQLAQKEEIKEVEVYQQPDKPGVFVAKDELDRLYYLILPNEKAELRGKNVLRVRGISNIENLNSSTELKWEKHIAQNAPQTPLEITKSWANQFIFKEETDGEPGLRPSQLGALHAIASHWSVKKNCGTVVMPTGTGKTEVMLSTLIYSQCSKVLILVPSSILRQQMFSKFSNLGCLREVCVVNSGIFNPRVTLIESGIGNIKEAKELITNSNVIVTTSQALHNFPDQIKQLFSQECSHLFIDEAHHVPAQTWGDIKNLFKEKQILQFTATPFRRDGKKIEGDIIYNYPLGMAQDDGYFKRINLIKIEEFDDNEADEKIAKFAIDALKVDLSKNHDHLLMARCSNKTRAEEIIRIYQKLAPEYNPISVNSDLTKKEIRESLDKLNNRTSKIIVCVDMLGEGFDLPNLKIAALHDTHKSLAITLQFIGRFTRFSKDVDDATVVINIGDPKVGKELEALYSEPADWNKLIKEKSESTIQREIDFHEFINNFSGELSKHISLWNLRPSYSTLVYETKCESWTPHKFSEIIPDKYLHWHAINHDKKVLVVVISKSEDVKWGRYKDIKNHSFELIVAHWSEEHKALFLQCSDYDAINSAKLSTLICGDSTKPKNGSYSFNIFSGVQRTLARNLGVSTVGKISYTMHFGIDITTGLSSLDKAKGGVLNNIFGWGYEDGERVSIGCSAKSGKVWSMGGGTIMEWKSWCHRIANKIFDNEIKESEIIKDFLRPKALEKRHSSIAILAQWGEKILSADEDNILVCFGDKEYKLYEVDLEITDFKDNGPIFFKIFSKDEESFYKISYGEKAVYSLVKGKKVSIKKYSKDAIPFIDYVETDPITIIYSDGSFTFNNYHVPTPPLNQFFDKQKINVLDWNKTDIQIESMGKDGDMKSIQHRVAEHFKNDHEIMFNDDASGEAADIIALRKESSDSFKLHLIHCKFSSKPTPGSRVEDFYALCGQAQKCIRWKHNGMEYLVDHMKRREDSWQKENKTRFIKGTMSDVNKLKKFARLAKKFVFEVSIVQPGLSKDKVSDDIIQLLGSTEDYLIKTSGATFNVISS